MKNKQKNRKEPRKDEYFEAHDENTLIEGRNGIMEALKAEKTIHRLFVRQGEPEGSLKVILAKAKERGVQITYVSREKLDAMSEAGKHQGIIALCPPFEYTQLNEILNAAAAKNQEPFLIILDKIFDPHNFGAIIRTACACGAHGVIIPKRRSVGITSAVVRASAGAAGHLPVARVANIAQTMDALKKQNIRIIITSSLCEVPPVISPFIALTGFPSCYAIPMKKTIVEFTCVCPAYTFRIDCSK